MPRLLLLTLLSFVTITSSGCGVDAISSASSPQEGAAFAGQPFDTPDAVYVAMVEATKNKDYKTMAALSTQGHSSPYGRWHDLRRSFLND